MRSLSGVGAALALAVIPGALVGQSVPNLTGTWVLQADKSDFGMMAAPQARTDVIEHQEPQLTIKRTVTTPNGEVGSNLVYVVDGKPHENMAGQTEVTSALHWEGAVLVMVSTAATGQGEATITDRFSLSDDGKTLTLARTIAIQGQELAQTMVFSRQEG